MNTTIFQSILNLIAKHCQQLPMADIGDSINKLLVYDTSFVKSNRDRNRNRNKSHQQHDSKRQSTIDYIHLKIVICLIF